MSFNYWQSYKVSEVVTLIGGGTPKTTKDEYWNGDIPWLSVKDFNDDYRKVYSTEKTITEAGLKNSSTKLLDKSDIIISARGTVGALAQLGKTMAFNQSCYGIKANSLTINDFIYYSLKNMLSNIKRNTHGSVFDTITRKTFDLLEIKLPPLNEQKAIANILSSLDEKIETNNQINETLENMAKALFKQWFVDFDFPNKNGEQYKSSGGEMVESEKGLIPKGWEVVQLDQISNITMGQSPKGTSYNENGEGVVFYQGRTDFNKRYPKRRLFTTEPKRIAAKGDILMSVRAPVGDINIAIEECCIGRGLAALNSKTDANSFLLYTMLKLRDEFEIYNGEGTVFGSINQKNLKSIKVIKPYNEVISLYENIVSSMDREYYSHVTESRRLEELRDTLLPKLMSGEIRVPLDDLEVSVTQ